MKATLFFVLTCTAALACAQNNQVVNAYNAIRNQEYDKGKIAADAASVHPGTRNSAKMWMYRGKIYQAIAESKKEEVRKLDNEAQEKAVESYINCLKNDKDNIYKDEVKDLLVQSCAELYHKTKYYQKVKDFDKATSGLELLEMALPYDFDQGLKHNNITKENLMYSRFKTYGLAGNKEKTKEFADKLMESKYKDPSVYTDMVKISLSDRDTAKALMYIEKGKLLFEDNVTLANQEINIYIAQKKPELIKNKLLDDISRSPDNEALHYFLAGVYDKTGDEANAEKEYLKALEIKPDYEFPNYHLGVLYFNRSNQWEQKLKALLPGENQKAGEYEMQLKEYLKKAAPYLEKAYEVSPGNAAKEYLLKIFTKLGNVEKAEKYK